MQWYCWLSIVMAVVVLAFRVGKCIPNGEPVIWNRHPRVKEGCKYFVLSVNSSRPSLANSPKCAAWQDEYELHNPFYVFLRPEDEPNVKPGCLVQPMWRDDKFILHVENKNQPVRAC